MIASLCPRCNNVHDRGLCPAGATVALPPIITDDALHVFNRIAIPFSDSRDYCTVCGLPERATCHLPPPNSVTFTLPFCPPSVNSLYLVNFKEPDPNKRITLRDDCRQWKNEAINYVPRFKVADTSIIRVDRTYYYDWFTKTKKWLKRDSFNMDKILFDAIAKKINVDDLRFKCGMMNSVNSNKEQTLVVLVEVAISEWSKDA